MKRSLFPWLAVLTLVFACATLEPAVAPASTPAVRAPGSNAGGCGDGVCNGSETESSCPADCNAGGAATPQPQAPRPTRQATAPAAVTTAAPTGKIPPIYFVYVIHAHASGEHLPFTNPEHKTIDPGVAGNMLAAIEGIADVLDAHGVPGTWEVTEATASGLCRYEEDKDVFARLLATGHEIGAHGHSTQGLQKAFLALQTDCGITAATASGFMTEVAKAGAAGAQAAIASEIQAALSLGMRVGTENLSPADQRNPFGDLCNDRIGPDNDMWAETGNLMFPWRPDYGGGDICADNPRGEMIFLDHVSINWTLRGEGGRPADVLTEEDFDRLHNYLEAALEYTARELPDRAAVWGFVTHIIEYSEGSGAENPPVVKSLDALDGFLTWVDSQRSTGRVIYVTAGQAASLAYP